MPLFGPLRCNIILKFEHSKKNRDASLENGACTESDLHFLFSFVFNEFGINSFWSCDLTICYHMAVCYMMKGRYQDVLAIAPEVRAKHGTLFELNDQNLPNRLQEWFNRLKHMELICKYMCWSQDSTVLSAEQ